MSTPSDDPPSENTQNPVSQVTQVNNDHQDAKVETDKEISPTSVFVNLDPLREEQVQNAVKFLSHPKVRGSPVIYRRSFLERKGLTKEEIDEAFRHVPDSAPAVVTTQSVVTDQDGQMKPSLNVQHQPPVQVLQSTPVGPAGSTSKVGTLSRFHWYHGILSVGLLTVSTVVLFKRLVVPKLKCWICQIVLEEDVKGLVKKNDAKPTIAEEAAAAAKAAATAAADVARTSQDVLMTNGEEKRCLEELISVLHVQASEMRSLRGQNINGRIAVEDQDNRWISRTSSGQPYANGKGDYDSRSVRSLSPPAPVEPSVAPHPKSYIEIMAMIQRGEKPSNIREINDAPPNPNQPLPNPRLAPKLKPWELSQGRSQYVSTFPSQASSNGRMIEFTSNGDNVVPWRQQKNARITEIDSGYDLKFASPNVLSNAQPFKRSLVPSQPPLVVMPEAAAAIRQPKKGSSQTETETQTETEQLSDDPQDVTDELLKSTKLSEIGCSLEASDQNFRVPSNEIMPLSEETASL